MPPRSSEPETREIRKSTTDPDSGYMGRDGKPKGFFYLDHRTADGRCYIITDVNLTPANVHDSRPYLPRLDHQKDRFGFDFQSVELDAGYFAAGTCKGLEDRSIYGVISCRRPTYRKGYFYKNQYRYDAEKDRYTCPENTELIYATTDRNGYRHYRSTPDNYLQCSQRAHCIDNAKKKGGVKRSFVMSGKAVRSELISID